jgi:four helix bundle protein
MKLETFEELDVWQKARKIVQSVYAVTQSGDFGRDWALKDQIRRAAISIMSNIAEGFNRFSPKEFILFLNTARGSSGEVRSQLYAALDKDYVAPDEFERIKGMLIECEKMCSGLARYLKNSGRKKSENQPATTGK